MSDVAQQALDSASHMRNAARVKRDEEELKQLMEQHNGTAQDEEEDAGQEDRVVKSTEVDQSDAEPDSKPLSKEEESFKKRYGDLRRHMQDKEQEWKERFEQLEMQVSKAARNELVLPKNEQDIEAWAKKYPDVAGIVEAIADKKASERSKDLDKRLKEIEDMRTNVKREKAEAELLSLHPDFQKIRSDDTFHEWAGGQPKWVQDALYENFDDAKSVARVIDLYKADNGISKQSNSYDKAAASSVKARSRNTPEADETKKYLRESYVNKMSTKDYEKHADEIMDAIRSGKFIYDVSR